MHIGSGSVYRKPVYTHVGRRPPFACRKACTGIPSKADGQPLRVVLQLCENIYIWVAHSVNMAERDNKISCRTRNKKASKLQEELFSWKFKDFSTFPSHILFFYYIITQSLSGEQRRVTNMDKIPFCHIPEHLEVTRLATPLKFYSRESSFSSFWECGIYIKVNLSVESRFFSSQIQLKRSLDSSWKVPGSFAPFKTKHFLSCFCLEHFDNKESARKSDVQVIWSFWSESRENCIDIHIFSMMEHR